MGRARRNMVNIKTAPPGPPTKGPQPKEPMDRGGMKGGVAAKVASPPPPPGKGPKPPPSFPPKKKPQEGYV